MSADDKPADRPLFEFVLDLEEGLMDLQDVLAALDLVASGCAPQGIEAQDMRGLVYLAKQARTLSARVKLGWTETLHRAARL